MVGGCGAAEGIEISVRKLMAENKRRSIREEIDTVEVEEDKRGRARQAEAAPPQVSAWKWRR